MRTSGEETRVYGGQSGAERRADRRGRFLDAGVSVLGEKGYAATSVADICAAAKLSRSQYYAEFDNREALLLDVYDLIQDETLTAVVAALDRESDRDFLHLITVAVTALVTSIGTDPRRARIAYIEMLGVSDRVEAHRAARRSVWAEFIESTIRDQVGPDFVPPGGYHLVATAFIGALTELATEWSRADPRPPVDGIATVMIEMLGAFAPQSHSS